MIEIYKTVNEHSETEIVEKKSKFIANVMPIISEEEANDILYKIRRKYYDARHNCYAYSIGVENPIFRFSDDGEPSGTAGKPILDVLDLQQIRNTLVVVTRYFGGTLLGTGGLVRAYGKSAKKGVIVSKIVEKKLLKEIIITVDYFLTGKIQYEVIQNDFNIIDTIYTDRVTFNIYVDFNKVELFKNNIVNITSDTAKIIEGDNIYKKFINNKLILED